MSDQASCQQIITAQQYLKDCGIDLYVTEILCDHSVIDTLQKNEIKTSHMSYLVRGYTPEGTFKQYRCHHSN